MRSCHVWQAICWSTELIDSKVTPKRESYQEHLPLGVFFFGAGTALLQGYALRNLAGYAASGLYSSFTIWGQAAGMVSDLAVELQDVQVHWKTGMVGVWIYGFPAEIIYFQRILDGFWFVTG